jgi:hypothetical protein
MPSTPPVATPAIGTRPTTLRRAPRLFLTVLLTVLLATAVAVPAQGATRAPYCGITWGSLAKWGGTPSATTSFRGVRAGHHSCYDRVVVVLTGKAPGYTVGYVPGLYYGSTNRELNLRGDAMLAIWMNGPQRTPAHASELVDVRGLTTVRQVAWGGTDYGVTSVVVGTRARLPYRVFTLHDGSTTRLVVDIAHRW